MVKRMVILVLGVLFICSAASGEIITIGIEGVVDGVGDPDNYLEGKVTVGSTITGWYIFDSDRPDQDWLLGEESPKVGRYHHFEAPYGMFLTVGGFEFQTDPTNVNFLIEISNNNTSSDDYLVKSSNNLPLYNGVEVDTIKWWLNDSSGNVFSNDSLPSTAPDLSQWLDSNIFSVGKDRAYGFSGYITNAYVIPEPSTILLFGLGAIFFRKK